MERCEICKHYHRLKHNFIRGTGFAESHCCDVLLHYEPDDEGWVQEVSPNDMCELFTEGKNEESNSIQGGVKPMQEM